MRPCPVCAEEIQDAARVCRFCGRDVDPLAALPPSPPKAPPPYALDAAAAAVLTGARIGVARGGLTAELVTGKVSFDGPVLVLKGMFKSKGVLDLSSVTRISHRGRHLEVWCGGTMYVVDFMIYGSECAKRKQAFARLTPAPLPPEPPQKWSLGKIAAAVFAGIVLLGLTRRGQDHTPQTIDPPSASVGAPSRPSPAAVGSSSSTNSERPSQSAAPAAMNVELRALLDEYKDNEVRADSQFKGKLIATTGLVDDVKKDIMGDIYVTIGTGASFEIPQVQCFFSNLYAYEVSRLSKGARVKVQGEVDGLLMNVLVRDCTLQP